MNDEEVIVKNITEIMNVPSSLVSKVNIAAEIKKCILQNHLTVRELGEKIGLKHPQIVRVTNGENYNIDTLIKILDGLNLEIVIKKKENKYNPVGEE